MPAICVTELRKALGDEARIPRFIETVRISVAAISFRIAKVKTPASVAPDKQGAIGAEAP